MSLLRYFVVDEHSTPAHDLTKGHREEGDSSDDEDSSQSRRRIRSAQKQCRAVQLLTRVMSNMIFVALKYSSKTASFVSKTSATDTEPCYGYRITDRMALTIAGLLSSCVRH
jgi:hypothetical protein